MALKVGDKHDYVMVTQSSLFDQSQGNLQVKANIELKCLRKKKWTNETLGVIKHGQMLEARIKSIEPVHLESKVVSSKSAGLQMATLFTSLKNIDKNYSSDKMKAQSIKLGAVNGFFGEMAESFGKWLKEMFQKLMTFFKQLVNRDKDNAFPGISLRCDDPVDRRQKRDSFSSINLKQFARHFQDLYYRPFTFFQLEDGSIKDIQISSEETDPNVILYKKFISNSFSTNLDDRKKKVLEKSDLGTHMSHYQMEYDEPDTKKVTPEGYMASMYRNVRRRSTENHLVSVVRSVRKEDLIGAHNQKILGASVIDNFDFSAQQVQLVRGNMLVASGK